MAARKKKKEVAEGRGGRYRECLKNHAAGMGGHVLDGCGEFMGGADDVLTCAACGCHRNFHRRSPARDPPCVHCLSATGGTNPNHSGNNLNHSGNPGAWPRMVPAQDAYMAQQQQQQQQQQVATQVMKKRFRTKFSGEQKEKMREFANKVAWRIQRQDEAALQQFCQDLGIRRHVLKIWMHNNKHNLAKKP